MKKYAVIDIGSNTVKMTAFEVKTDKGDSPIIERVAFSSTTLGIGAKRVGGVIEDDAINELKETLILYKKSARRNDCEEILCFATASLRGAENSEEIQKKIKRELDIWIDIVSGEEEGKLCFLALKYLFGRDISGFTADMGGGSTEISSFSKGKLLETTSFPFGCLSLKNKFVKGDFPDEFETENISKHVSKELKKIKIEPGTKKLWLTGGTAKAVAKIHAATNGRKYDKDLPFEMTPSDFFVTSRFLAENNEDKIKIIKALVPSRLYTVTPGAVGLMTICDIISPEEITISDIGMREGYLLSYIGKHK